MNPALNGERVIAHDPTTGATYVRLPRELWRSCGTCQCPSCLGKEGFWDTLVIPTKGYTWAAHMPNPGEFQAYADQKAAEAKAARKAARAAKKAAKEAEAAADLKARRPQYGQPWE